MNAREYSFEDLKNFVRELGDQEVQELTAYKAWETITQAEGSSTEACKAKFVQCINDLGRATGQHEMHRLSEGYKIHTLLTPGHFNMGVLADN
jgi:hypothetical protein